MTCERVARVRGMLPEDATDPQIFKFDAASIPIVNLGLTGDIPLDKIRKYADDEIKYRLEQIAGVAAVNVRGGLEREIHVDVDRSQMEAIGLSFSQITNALHSENLDKPGGYLETTRSELLLRTSGQYTSLQQIANTVIGYQSGTPIYLHQVAQVSDSFKERRSDTRLKGEQGVFLSVQRMAGENTVKVSDRVLKQVDAINKILPSGMKLFVTRDSAKFIRDSLNQMQSSALIGAFLAVIILIVFLRNIRSTIIIALAIPIAVVATFILMYAAKLTLNMMSLGGLALGVGMLVDNSVVVLENIFRHREWGEGPAESASVGTNEVSAAITASTLTTLCVFFPMFFAAEGMQGVFFSQLAYTISFSLIASLLVALTLVPVMSARYLHIKQIDDTGSRSKIKKGIKTAFDNLGEKYGNALNWILDHRLWVMIVCPLMLAIVLALAQKLAPN